jgi:hypothetical protein
MKDMRGFPFRPNLDLAGWVTTPAIREEFYDSALHHESKKSPIPAAILRTFFNVGYCPRCRVNAGTRMFQVESNTPARREFRRNCSRPASIITPRLPLLGGTRGRAEHFRTAISRNA